MADQDPIIGQYIGGYQVVRLIGSGGMANVYLGEQTHLRRQAAIKLMQTRLLRDERNRRRFEREMRTIAALENPRILPIWGEGIHDDGSPYIIMPYMPGGTLADQIEATPGGLDLQYIAYMAVLLGEGLDHSHASGVIHRDFKPSNVLLDSEGNPYIADFGIAKTSEQTAALTGSAILGTPNYMAPEHARSGEISSLTDVYALAVTLYEMLTGRRPFEADTPLGVMMQHLEAAFPDPQEFRTNLPPEVIDVLSKGMAKDPLDRYQSAGELGADFYAAVYGEPLRHYTRVPALAQPARNAAAGPYPLGTPPDDESSQRNRFWMLPVGIAGLTVFILSILFADRVFSPPNEPAAPTTAEEVVEGLGDPSPEPEEPVEAVTEPLDEAPDEPAAPTAIPAESLPVSWRRLTAGSEDEFTLAPVNSVVTDPFDAQVSYAATRGAGIYKSANAGSSWSASNGGLTEFDVLELANTPANTRLLLAATEDGIWRSTDAANSWTLSEGLTFPVCVDRFCELALSPTNDSVAYFSSFDGDNYWIYVSTNGGVTWSGSVVDYAFIDLYVSWTDPGLIYAGAISLTDDLEGGVFLSSDSGATWTELGAGQTMDSIHSVIEDPNDPNTLYIAWGRIMQSTDGGVNWESLTNDLTEIGPLAYDSTNDQVIAHVTISGGTGEAGLNWGIWSYDGSASTRDFGSLPDPRPEGVANFNNLATQQTYYVYGWSRYPDEESIDNLAYGYGAAYVTPGAVTSNSATITQGSGLPLASTGLLVDATNGNRLYTSGPVSLDGGTTWDTNSTRFGVTDPAAFVYEGGLGYYYHVDRQVYISDDPVAAFPDGNSQHWFYLWKSSGDVLLYIGSDYRTTAALLSEANYITHYYDSSCPTTLWRKSGTEDATPVEIELPGDFCRGYIRSDAAASNIYAIDTLHVYVSQNSGETWTDITPDEVGGRVLIMNAQVNPQDGEQIWIGTTGAGILALDSHGGDWEWISGSLSSQTVNQLVMAEDETNTLYAATNDGVFITTDGGQTWGAARQGLSASQIVYSVAVDPQDPTRVFIATAAGVYQIQ